MKVLLIALLTVSTFSAWANKHDRHDRKKPRFTPSVFDVKAINSPVKESTAKFSMKLPKGFDVDEVKYKVKSANRLFEKERNFEEAKVVNGSELHIPVSRFAPGFYQLFVTVRDRKTRKHHIFQTKLKDYAVFVIDSSLQVPMPNPTENNKTIAGIDTDKDGIRDDIQRWINESYSSLPEKRLAVRQFAMASQLSLLNVSNKEQSISSSIKLLESSSCLTSIVGLEEKVKIYNELETKLLNTKERHYANMQSNENFSGQSFTLPSDDEIRSLCDF